MAGQFTHILVAKHALERLQKNSNFPFLKHKPFIYAGSVAPDLPYFVKGSDASFDWAERMHHYNTKSAILSALDYLEDNYSDESNAWFMGYIAHVITDMTIHPVVNAISGPYYTEKREAEAQHSHRYTEMIQDSFVISEFCQSDFDPGEFSTDLTKVADKISNNKISSNIENIWNEILRSSDSKLFADKKPEIDNWYKNYLEFMTSPVDASVISDNEMIKFLGCKAIIYKDLAQIDEAIFRKYITKLPFPVMSNQLQPVVESKFLNYSEVFTKTVFLVKDTWDMMSSDRSEFLKTLDDWSLDTGGLIGDKSHMRPIFW